MTFGYKKLVLFVLLAVFLTACAQKGAKISKEKIDEKLAVPDTFAQVGEDTLYSGKWWEVFNNPELNSLMEQMLANNKELAGSYEGLKALQTVIGIKKADKMPTLDAGIEPSDKYSTNSSGTREWRDNYEVSMTASYEIDVWGRLKAAVESAGLSMLASKYDLETMYMTLSAEFADRYFLYKTLASVQKMQKEMLDLRKKQVYALEMMYASGVGTLDELYVMQTNIANLMEDMTETSQSMQEAKLQMALMMGETDARKIVISDSYTVYIPTLPKLIPSDVAKQRPDIKSAFSSVLKVDRDVAAAAANRYPKLSLAATVYYSGDDLSSLISADNFVANILGNLTVPLFNAGSLKKEKARQEILLKQEIINYYQTILEGLNEVNTSLGDNIQNKQALKLSEEKVAILEKRLKVSEMKYEMGIGDYSDVLDIKISLLTGWVTEINARRDLISSRIELARAAGGSWAGEIVDDTLKKAAEKETKK